jgi:hypothetical protein
MSLTRLVMRLACVQALKGQTLAGTRVFDSAVAPLDLFVEEHRQPLIVVTTDEHEADITGRDLMSGTQTCDLVIEIAIAAASSVSSSNDAGEAITIEIPHTDEGMELTLDMLEHQCVAALIRGTTPWATIWMNLVPRVTRRLSRRGASSENGLRFAARQIVLTCDLVDTPTRTADLSDSSAWGLALAAMDGNESLAPLASILRAEIDGGGLADWQIIAQSLGLTDVGVRNIGLEPALDENGDPVPLDAVLIDEGGSITTIDAPSVDEQGV